MTLYHRISYEHCLQWPPCKPNLNLGMAWNVAATFCCGMLTKAPLQISTDNDSSIGIDTRFESRATIRAEGFKCLCCVRGGLGRRRRQRGATSGGPANHSIYSDVVMLEYVLVRQVRHGPG